MQYQPIRRGKPPAWEILTWHTVNYSCKHGKGSQVRAESKDVLPEEILSCLSLGLGGSTSVVCECSWTRGKRDISAPFQCHLSDDDGPNIRLPEEDRSKNMRISDKIQKFWAGKGKGWKLCLEQTLQGEDSCSKALVGMGSNASRCPAYLKASEECV